MYTETERERERERERGAERQAGRQTDRQSEGQREGGREGSREGHREKHWRAACGALPPAVPGVAPLSASTPGLAHGGIEGIGVLKVISSSQSESSIFIYLRNACPTITFAYFFCPNPEYLTIGYLDLGQNPEKVIGGTLWDVAPRYSQGLNSLFLKFNVNSIHDK